MPFTPFHMGVALALKPAMRRRFSVLAFGLAQVAMDLEPLLAMLRDRGVLHGWSHTVAGAIAIGALVAVGAPPLLGPAARWMHRKAGELRLAWLFDAEAPSARAVWTGAMVGTLSHVGLDALIHRDMEPFAPLSPANPWVGLVGHEAVYIACAALVVVGGGAWALMRWRTRGDGQAARSAN